MVVFVGERVGALVGSGTGADVRDLAGVPVGDRVVGGLVGGFTGDFVGRLDRDCVGTFAGAGVLGVNTQAALAKLQVSKVVGSLSLHSP
jgi:hypothetical protein